MKTYRALLEAAHRVQKSADGSKWIDVRTVMTGTKVKPGKSSTGVTIQNTFVRNSLQSKVMAPGSDEYSIEIYSLNGSKIKQQINKIYPGVNNSTIELPAALPAGIYLLAVSNNKGQRIYTSKLLKH